MSPYNDKDRPAGHQRRYNGSVEYKRDTMPSPKSRGWHRRLNQVYLMWRFNPLLRHVFIVFLLVLTLLSYFIMIKPRGRIPVVNTIPETVSQLRSLERTKPVVSQGTYENYSDSANIADKYINFGDLDIITSLENGQTHIRSHSRGHRSHDFNDLRRVSKAQFAVSSTVTIIVAVSSKDDVQGLEGTMQALIAQSVRPARIWILTPHSYYESVKKTMTKYEDGERISVSLVDQGNTAIMAKATSAHTDYVLIIEKTPVPGRRYVQNLLQISTSEEFSDTLIGTAGVQFPLVEDVEVIEGDNAFTCFGEGQTSQELQRVDYLIGGWLLKRSWVDTIMRETRQAVNNLPLGFWISSTLQRLSNIDVIVAPTRNNKDLWLDTRSSAIGDKECTRLQNDALARNAISTQLRRGFISTRQAALFQSPSVKNVVFVMAGLRDAHHLSPLICKMAENSEYLVQVVNLGAEPLLTYESYQAWLSRDYPECPIKFYDLGLDALDLDSEDPIVAVSISHCVDRLLDRLRAKAVIYASDFKDALTQGMQMTTRARNVISIGMPMEDIAHAMWIADLPSQALQHWNTPIFEMSVITKNRPTSLKRLVESLRNMHYFGDKAHLTISVEQNADNVTRDYVDGIEWDLGTLTKRHRLRRGGLIIAVTESWYPMSDHHYGVLLEDDIELSPYAYAWMKYSILKYRYGPDKNIARRLYGISLYNMRAIEMFLEGRRQFAAEKVLAGTKHHTRSPYIHQTPCSWGAVYFPEHWREFHHYINGRLSGLELNDHFDVKIPGAKSNSWKKSWKRFLIELAYFRGYVMLYPNYPDFISLSTNHFESGAHVNDAKKQKQLNKFEVPLMKEDRLLADLPTRRLLDFKDLPLLDFWGKLTPWTTVLRRGVELHKEYSSCPAPAQDVLRIPEDDEAVHNLAALGASNGFDAGDLLCIPPSKTSYLQLAVDVNALPQATAFSNLVGKPNPKYKQVVPPQRNLPSLPVIQVDEGSLGVQLTDKHNSPSNDLPAEAEAIVAQLLEGDEPIRERSDLDDIVRKDPLVPPLTKEEDESHPQKDIPLAVLLQGYEE